MNLIYQYYIGDEVPQFAKISRFTLSEYADKYGHEYLFSTTQYLPEETHDNWKMGAKFFDIIRVYMDPYFDQYDQVLFADVDVIASLSAPDIFEYRPKHIAGWTEQKHPNGIAGPGYPKGSDKYQQIESAFKEFDAPMVESVSPHAYTRILNSGVLLFSKEARILAREKFDDWRKWYNRKYRPWITLDQLYLSAMFNKYGFDVKELSNEWNITPSWFPANSDLNGWFYHFSGDSKKDIPKFFSDNFTEFNI
jgi:hypothetical protein